jgi:hypothetical protein
LAASAAGRFERQIGRWSTVRASRPGDRLDGPPDRPAPHSIADEASSIVHGDFRLDNLIVRGTGRGWSPCSTGLSTSATRSTLVSRDGGGTRTVRGMAARICAALRIPTEQVRRALLREDGGT